jgi:hypothetical protein
MNVPDGADSAALTAKSLFSTTSWDASSPSGTVDTAFMRNPFSSAPMASTLAELSASALVPSGRKLSIVS